MSNTITITAATGEDMQALGERLAKLARGGDVLLLSGPLGAGKTTFAQGFGAGLGIGEPIVSPTFTIARELEGRFADGSPAHLVHVDAYRLGGNAYAPGQEELLYYEALGVMERLAKPTVTYTVDVQNLSGVSGYEQERFTLDTALRIWDEPLE